MPCSPWQHRDELGAGLAVSIFQSHSAMGSYSGPRGPHAWPQASWLRGCTGTAPSSWCIQCPLGLSRLPWGAGQGVEPSECSLNLKAAMI